MKKGWIAAIALVLVLIGLALVGRGSLTGFVTHNGSNMILTFDVNRTLTASSIMIPLNGTVRIRSILISGDGVGAQPYVRINGRTYPLASNGVGPVSGFVTAITTPKNETPLDPNRVIGPGGADTRNATTKETPRATPLSYGNGPYDVDNNGIVGPQDAVDFQVNGTPACVIWTVVSTSASLFCRGNDSCCTQLGFPHQNGSSTYLVLTRATAGGTDGTVLARASNESFSDPLTFSFGGTPERYASYSSSCGAACSVDRVANSIAIGTRTGRLDLVSVSITYQSLNGTLTNETRVEYGINASSGAIVKRPASAARAPPSRRAALVQSSLVSAFDRGRRERVVFRNSSGVYARVLDKAGFDSLVRGGSVSEAAIDAPVSVLSTDALGITGISAVRNATGLSGAGETVCVVDAGVNVQILRDANVQYSTFNVLDNTTNASDGNGHGTEVTDALLRAAPGARYVIVKAIADNGTGYESDVIRGMQVCAQQGSNVVSLSVGSGLYNGTCDQNVLAQEANLLVSNGTIVVAAAGNEAGPILKSPACASNVTAVISTDANDSLSSFSSYLPGQAVLAAPGETIATLDKYANPTVASGTSMAAPFVSGAAALLLENDSNLTPLGIRSLLVDTGSYHNTSGFAYSRLDLKNALSRNQTNTLSTTLTGAQGTGSSNGTVQTLTNISSCQNITAIGSYTLTTNVASPGTCMNITSSNVVLDCASHTINYSSAGSGNGVWILPGVNNTVVKNCVIVQSLPHGTSANRYAILANGTSTVNSTNLTFSNLTIETWDNSSQGIRPRYAAGVNITGVTVTIHGDFSSGIDLFYTPGALVANSVSLSTGTSSPAFLTTGSDAIHVSNVNATATGASSYGLNVQTGNDNGLFESVRIASAQSYGLLSTTSVGNTYDRITVDTNGSRAASFESSSDNTTVSNSTLTGNYSSIRGIEFLNSRRPTVSNVTIMVYGNSSARGLLLYFAPDSLVENSTIHTSGNSTEGLYVQYSNRTTITKSSVDTNGSSSHAYDLRDVWNLSMRNSTGLTRGNAYAIDTYKLYQSNITDSNLTVIGTNGRALDTLTTANVTFVHDRFNATASGGRGVLFQSNTNDLYFKNSTINSDLSTDVYFVTGSNANNVYFENVTYNSASSFWETSTSFNSHFQDLNSENTKYS